MNIIDAMRERKSVRSYTGTPLNADQTQDVEQAISGATSPFGSGYTIRLIQYAKDGDFTPGTYGVIKGAKDYLIMAIDSADAESVLGAGYAMEQVVLHATELGLGTCWIAATFKGSDFDRGQQWPQGQVLKIVSPIGIPAGKKSILEKFTRFSLGSKGRKSFESLFFERNFGTPLSPESQFGEALAMMRLAPSSTNSQPWRAVVCGDDVHFYRNSDAEVALLNCGIALCHFTETEKFHNHEGTFFKSSTAPEAPKGCMYVRSYRRTR